MFHKRVYEPGEAYEFPDTYWNEGLMRYRCFRGNCAGAAVLTGDRDRHNGYHNKRGE